MTMSCDNTKYTREEYNRYCWHYKRLYNIVNSVNDTRFVEAFNRALRNGYPVDFSLNVNYHPNSLPLLMIAITPDSSAWQRQRKIINMLLDAGADVNLTDRQGLNVLMQISLYLAAKNQSVELFARVLRQTEDINKKSGGIYSPVKINKDGQRGGYEYRTAFQFLAENYIIEAYITPYGGAWAQHYSSSGEAERNILPKIQMLLDAGADPGDPDEWISAQYSEIYLPNPTRIQNRLNELKTYVANYQEQKQEQEYQLNNNSAEVYYDYEL